MKVTIEELRKLRAQLTTHRLQHESLVTHMQMLRQHCQEVRENLALLHATRDDVRNKS